jgi:hypothetical protein
MHQIGRYPPHIPRPKLILLGLCEVQLDLNLGDVDQGLDMKIDDSLDSCYLRTYFLSFGA